MDWEEESEEEGRAGRGGGDRKPLPPLCCSSHYTSPGNLSDVRPQLLRQFRYSMDSCGFLRIPEDSWKFLKWAGPDFDTCLAFWATLRAARQFLEIPGTRPLNLRLNLRR